MKKMVISMIDARLGALEATSAESLKLQSKTLESLRELHLKAAVQAPPPTRADRDRKIAEFAKTLD